MKSFFEKRSSILIYLVIATIGANTILPTIAVAETASNLSDDYSEIDSTNLPDESLIKKTTLNDKIDLSTLSEIDDKDFLSQISLETNEGNLMVTLYDEFDSYKFDLNTYEGEYTLSESNEGKQEICFLNLSTKTAIDISLENKHTFVKYNLILTTKSEELDNIDEDISIELLKEELKDDSTDTEVVEEPANSEEVKEVEESSTSIDSEITNEIKENEVVNDSIDAEISNEPKESLEKSYISNSKTFATMKKRIAVNGIYTIVSGDNLNSIATEFGISLAQLAIWNDITKDKINSIKVGQKLAISKLGFESRLSETERNKIYKNSTTLFEKQEFIDYIAPYAVKVANLKGEEPLYASVIIAQAIHESAFGNSGLSNPPNFNLTGIKGSYNGEYVKMWTWEHDTSFNADINVLANFRKYPSYYEALLDHGTKMRYGTTWNSKIYAGTWIKNTTSYKDATAALDGVYATDPYGYANKLNNYIKQYNLTDYDIYDSLLSQKNVNYTATVSSNNQGIYTKPYGMKDAALYTSYKYNNKDVKVTEEATTNSGTFVKLVSLEDNGILGWIKKSNIKAHDDILTRKKVEYYATVLSKNDGIYTQPFGMRNSVLYTSYKYNNKKVKATEEATTASGTFVKLVSLEDNGTLGWIKKSSVKIYDGYLTTKKVEYYATVLAKNDGIYTKPKGLPESVLYTSYKYNNKKVKAIEEATTASGTFVKLVSLEDNGTLGWIKKSSVKIYDGYLTTKQVEYYATVLAKNDGIYTKPKGLPGSVLYTSYKYNNKKVKATEEATTASGTFVKLVSLEDNGTLGWIKKSSVKIYDGYLTTKKVEYYATVLANNEGIYTKPKGLPGSVLYTSYKYNNKKVKITEEATTASGTFVKVVNLEDNGTLGWTKKSSVIKK